MLISDEYREQNARLHRENQQYGTSSGRWADPVLQIARRLDTRSVLDYGCGKGDLGKEMPFDIVEYDPAIPGKDARPQPADVVVCTDVLEHIEPDCLDAVLDDLAGLSRQVAFLTVATREAGKTLPDGRNAHLIVQPAEWWLPKLMARFSILQFNKLQGGEFLFIGESLCADEPSTH